MLVLVGPLCRKAPLRYETNILLCIVAGDSSLQLESGQ